MTNELNTILSQHAAWLRGDSDGARADFTGANLRYSPTTPETEELSRLLAAEAKNGFQPRLPDFFATDAAALADMRERAGSNTQEVTE